MIGRYNQYLISFACIAILALFILFPVLETFIQSVRIETGEITLAAYLITLQSQRFIDLISNSLLLALTVTALSLFLALPISLFVERFNFVGRRLCELLILAPLILPPFVGAIGIRRLFSRYGPINLTLLDVGIIKTPIDWLGDLAIPGAVVVQVFHLYPIIYIMLRSSLSRMDISIEEAAYTLGASSIRSFIAIVIPLLRPAILSGCSTVFVWSLTDIGTPLIFDLRDLLPVEIFAYAYDQSHSLIGSTLVCILLVITILSALLSYRSTDRYATSISGRSSYQNRRKELPLNRAFIGAALLFLVTIIGIVPHIGIAISAITESWYMTKLPTKISVSAFGQITSHPLTALSIKHSLIYSLGSTFIDLVLGGTIAWLLARSSIKTKSLLNILSSLPLAVPGIILAFSYLGAFADTILDPRKDPTAILVIGYAIRRLPLMVRSAYVGLNQIPITFEESAANLGARFLTIARKILLPLAFPHLISGIIICFCFSILEVSESLILAMKEEDYPVTKAMYTLLSRPDGVSVASALGISLMLLMLVGYILSNFITNSRKDLR